MDRRITLGGIVLLLLLGGYIWYAFLRADAPQPTVPTTPEPTPIAFLSLDADKIQSVEVKDMTNNQVTRVVRVGDKWNMEAPKQGEASATNVEDLLFALARLNAERKFDAPGDLTQFGLNPPQYQAKFTMQDASEVMLSLGKKNPDGSSYYVLKNGDGAVYLIVASTGDTVIGFVTAPPYTPTPTETLAPTETPEATPTTASTVPAATPTP